MTALLEIRDYRLAFDSFDGTAQVLDGIDLALEAGGTLGIVGETGCGKSVLARSLLGLNPMPPARVVSGQIAFRGEDILNLPERAMRRLRGRAISMIFQDPASYLNPLLAIGTQMEDAIRGQDQAAGAKQRPRSAARAQATSLLAAVGLPEPTRLLDSHPHMLSGGMRQRVLIAMALIGKPDLLIADEPTTALDVSVQAQVLKLMTALAREDATAVLFITHNLGVVAKICSHVAVMYAGNIVETGSVKAVFKAPQHPYTRALMAAVPKPGVKRGGLEGLAGVVPNLLNPPPGCRFAPRCHLAVAECTAALPALRGVEAGHGVACIMANASS
jgi:oligopeptide/dipeptide ABC transporter ATP-binding protein